MSTTVDPVAAGGRLLYTITIGNISNVSVAGVTLVLPVPTGLQFFLMSPFLHLSVHGSLLVFAVVLITLVTAVAAFYPSMKAARLQPVDAMSHFG